MIRLTVPLPGLLIAGTICSMLGCQTSPPVPGEAALRPRALIALKVERRTVAATFVAAGVLEPVRKVDLAPLASARIKDMRVQVGERVRKGQLLVVMDDAELVSTIAQFQPLKARYDRAQRLIDNKAMTRAQFEEIESEYVAMNRRLSQIEENTTLKAPFAGVVVALGGSNGENWFAPCAAVAEGEHALVRVAQLDRMRMQVWVPERIVVDLRPAMNATVRIGALGDTLIETTLAQIAPGADPQSGHFAAWLYLANPAERLRPGFRAQVSLALGEKKGVITLPVSAVRGSRVFVYEKGLVRQTRVVTGSLWDDQVEITGGLTESAVVIVDPPESLRDGVPVTVTF